jgi:predicted XRE-type DNA-binding protein
MSYMRLKKKAEKPRRATLKSRAAGLRSSSASVNREANSIPDSQITESTGNVFLDLGFGPHEAESLLIRSKLMIQITEIIRQRKLTQARAAKLFHVTQPRISDLMRAKLDLFSIDSLLSMLSHAGMHAEIRLRPKAA